MPLPTGDIVNPWPPANMQPLFARMNQWSALFTGDLATMQAAFGGGTTADQTGAFASDKGGFKANVGRALQRFFLGEPTRGTDRNTKVPIPIAAEICQASADLLFADPITVTVGRQDGQKAGNETELRLAVLLDDRFHSTLAEAAELAAALGGAYLRVTWDPVNVPGQPFSTVVDADNALPEFAFGRLIAVTFWWVVKTDGETVWRHIERHETDPDTRNGVIRHGLYQGTADKLGLQVELTNLTETTALATQMDLGYPGTIDTKSPGLAVQYLPNQVPNRGWRSHPVGRYLGRSDLDGIEHLIDQLAEVMSAWTRAIRLAKARLFIAKSLTQSGGAGGGLVANLEQEAYVTVEKLGSGGSTPPAMSDQMQLLQAKVEHEQYSATASALLEQIIQAAGYSPGTFGIDNGAGRSSRTATEVESKERRSLMTRDRKIRECKPPIGEHITKLLAIDNALFQRQGKPANLLDGIDVVFAEGVQQTQLALAQTVLALYQAESASTSTRVAILNPSWDDDKVQDEVALIEAEFAQAPPLMGGGFPPMPGDPGDPDDPTPEQ